MYDRRAHRIHRRFARGGRKPASLTPRRFAGLPRRRFDVPIARPEGKIAELEGTTVGPDVPVAGPEWTTAGLHGTIASLHGTTASLHGTTASLHGTTASLEVPVASRFRARLLGLAHLDRAAAGPGLLLTRCSSVHTFGMRFALEVYFLGPEGEILEARREVPPRRLLACRGAAAVLEIPA